MSNQVFSNSTQKYYAMRGVNFYEPIVGQAAPVNVPTIIDIQNDQIQNDRVLRILNDKYLEIVEEGVYSFTCSIASAKESGSGIYYYQCAIEAVGTGSLAVERLVQPAVVGDDAAFTILSVSFTGYLPRETRVYFSMLNFGPVPLDVVTENSVITACKVY